MARILVVDDETDVREFINDALRLGGHTIEAASNGPNALDLLQGKRFDIVILDRNMPMMSGLEVLTELKRRPEHKALKVLMCTASGMVSDADEALAAGAVDYIVKPIDVARLLDKVTRHAPPPGAATEPEPGGLKGLMRRLLGS